MEPEEPPTIPVESAEAFMKVFTIGYGGRNKEDILALLQSHGVKTVVDIRLRPDRVAMGIFTKAKTPDKGIEKLLAEAGIGYRSLVELGNVFIDAADWRDRYRRLMDSAGKLLTERLNGIPGPICLLCAEKQVEDCHRQQVAEYLRTHASAVIQHLV